jgi:hypothetical protein
MSLLLWPDMYPDKKPASSLYTNLTSSCTHDIVFESNLQAHFIQAPFLSTPSMLLKLCDWFISTYLYPSMLLKLCDWFISIYASEIVWLIYLFSLDCWVTSCRHQFSNNSVWKTSGICWVKYLQVLRVICPYFRCNTILCIFVLMYWSSSTKVANPKLPQNLIQ